MAEAVEAVFEGAELSAEGSYLDDLLPVLQRLDRLLERAVAAAQAAYGPQAAADPYRGLYINQDGVTRLLAREPGAPTLQMEYDPGVSTNHAESEKQSKEHPTGQQGRGLRSLVGRWLPTPPSAPGASRANEPLDAGLMILAGTQPWVPSGRGTLGVITVPFPIPGFAQRRDCWQAELAAAGIALNEHDLDMLAGRFRLTPHQIAEAVATACSYTRWHAAVDRSSAAGGPKGRLRTQRSAVEQLFAAARVQTGHDLAALAHKIEPIYTWGDIVLPDDTLSQLWEICQRVAHRDRVLGEWGFDHKLSLGKGVNVLFAGPFCAPARPWPPRSSPTTCA